MKFTKQKEHYVYRFEGVKTWHSKNWELTKKDKNGEMGKEEKQTQLNKREEEKDHKEACWAC